jgi:hypothetical protein
MVSKEEKINEEYSIFPTNICNNNCVICGVKCQPNFNFYHLLKNDSERKGLIKLLSIFESNDLISLTGGDPLRNPEFMELFIKHFKGRKSIMLNPLTFLSLESGKPANVISEKEAESIINKVSSMGYCDESMRLLNYLSYFDNIGISSGNLQSPNPALSKYAIKLWGKYIFKYLISNTRSRFFFINGSPRQSLSGKFENNKLVRAPKGLKCVGSLRRIAESQEKTPFSIKFNIEMKRKHKKCHTKAKSAKYPLYPIYFNKVNDEVKMFFLPCCEVGVNPYVAYETELTLNKIASLKTEDVKKLFHKELSKMKKSSFFKLLTNKNYNLNFKTFIQIAEKMIKERSNQNIDIVSETYTCSDKCHHCEVCNTVGVMLHRAKITPKEWHEYLEKNNSIS